MDFASVSTLGDELFSTDDAGLNWLYSASLLTVCIVSILCTWVMQRWKRGGNWVVMGMAAVSNVAGGWARWYSVREGSYSIAMASSILLGLAAAGIIVSIVPLAKHNFDEAQRTLSTTIAVQLNYGGWCVSSVVIPSFSSTADELEDLMFLQAIIISVGLPLFVLFHRPRPESCCGSADRAGTALRRASQPTATYSILDGVHEHEEDAEGGSLWDILTNRNFIVQSLSFSMLGGISFAIPAVQDEIFNDLGLEQGLTKWTNLGFLMSGVASGLLLGVIFHRCGIEPTSTTSMWVLRAIFVVCTIALISLASVSYFAAGGPIGDGVTVLIFASMIVSGACSLGFVGVALSQAVAVAHPVSEIYSAAFVEWCLQIWGVVFSQLCAGSGGGGGDAPSPAPNATDVELLTGRDGTAAGADARHHQLGFAILASGSLLATLGLFCSTSKNTMEQHD